ncbi:hypothetical protein M2324_003636 [Rhodovulum sulfidophilum]|nr:hypothetical protein [Rhodovulum sulfidophilum]
MYKRLKPFVMDTWTWFRSKSVFVQCLLVVPVTCALAFTLLVGNMGLALMGTAIALNSVVVGGLAGLVMTIFGKAAAIILRDKHRTR